MNDSLTEEIYGLFRCALPYVIREDEVIFSILKNQDNTIIEKRNEEKKLIGVSVVHKNAIMLLAWHRSTGNGVLVLGFWKNQRTQSVSPVMRK